MKAEILPTHTAALFRAAVSRAAELLRAGEVVALPTETVYGLAANALDAKAVARIYEIKGRPAHNPIIVHVSGYEMAQRCVANWPESAGRLAHAFWPGPLTLVLPRSAEIPEIVTAGGDTVGVRWPSHPFIQAVIRECGFPLAAPSANPANRVSPTNAEHVGKSLGDKIKLIVDGGQSQVGIESTVVDVTTNPPRVLRPGMIHDASLQAALGDCGLRIADGRLQERAGEPLRSPGNLPKHYSPKAQLLMFAWQDEAELQAKIKAQKFSADQVHVIAHTVIPGSGKFARVSVIPHDAEAFARALYAELHQCDEDGAGLIIVEALPETDEWRAIADRLKRAAGLNPAGNEHNLRPMPLFDEMKRIKQSSRWMQLKRSLFVLLACAMALTAGAENTPADASTNSLPIRKTRTLSLAECIQLALEHNLDIQIQRYNPLINNYTVKSDNGVYDPTFSFSANKRYNDRPGGIDPQTGLPFGANINEADNYTPELKGFLPSGLTYDLVGTMSRQSQRSTTSPGFWLPPNWESESPGPGINLSQPVLKNFWIDKSRLQIQLDKASLKISQFELRRQIMTTVTSVKSAYYTLLYNRGNVEANATALKLAQQLVSENLKRVEVGALAPLDEKQSESQAAASQAALQAAQQALVVQENALKNLLTDHYAEWADVTPIPAEELQAVPQELNLQESWRRAVEQRPELAEAKLNVEKQNVTLKYTRNQLFPELDITGSYGRNANSTTFDGSIDGLGRGDHSYYSYGVVASIPLGNIAARNNHKSAKLSLKQVLLTLKQQEQIILVSVDNDVGQVRSTLEQVGATKAARIYAEDALAAERKKLENGKSTSFIILQLISTLTTARVNELQALSNYNIAVAQLSLDEGSTLQANHIDLNLK